MTTRDLRLMYKRETGLLPNGSYLSMDGRKINANLDPELSNYIAWLEKELVRLKILTRKLIPFET